MEGLFLQDAYLTRLALVSAANKLPDLEPAVQRLMRIQNEIANQFSPFGMQVSQEIYSMLTKHVSLMVSLMGGMGPAFAQTKQAWYENAANMADLLDSINPQAWPYEQLQGILVQHLNLILQQIGQYMNKDYGGSFQTLDQVMQQSAQLVQALQAGLGRSQQGPGGYVPRGPEPRYQQSQPQPMAQQPQQPRYGTTGGYVHRGQAATRYQQDPQLQQAAPPAAPGTEMPAPASQYATPEPPGQGTAQTYRRRPASRQRGRGV